MKVLKALSKFIDFFLKTRTLCKIKNIPIRLHVTFYGVVVLMLYGTIRTYIDGNSEWAVEAISLFKYLIVFTCVTLHELGHSLWARKKGYPTKDILLIAIGGLARIEKLPSEPKKELGIAVAGPTVNLAICSLFFIIALFFDYKMVNWVWQVNLAILLFNLVPAYPMDGGRILRSLLNLVMNARTATNYAMGIALGIFSLFIIGGFKTDMHQLVFIGFFMSALIGLEFIIRKKKPEMFHESYNEIETPFGTVTTYLDEGEKKFVVNGTEEAIRSILKMHNVCAIPGCGKKPLKEEHAFIIDFEKGISVCSQECREKYHELYENTTN